MSSHHDHNNHSNEAKPVAFRTPLILALVTMLAIVLAVSTCDKKHGCCEDGKESCETKHDEHHAHDAHGAAKTEHTEEAPAAEHAVEHAVVNDTIAKIDTAALKIVEVPAHH